MSYRCRKSQLQGCGRFFSVKTGMFMEASNLGCQDGLFALSLVATNLMSVSSMKLHGDISVTQRTAWHMANRICKALSSGDGNLFEGPVEVDETYMGGKRRNMSHSNCEDLTVRGPVGRAAVLGLRDRSSNKVAARVVDDTTSDTLQGFVKRQVVPTTTVYTAKSTAYGSLPNHEVVKRSVSE